MKKYELHCKTILVFNSQDLYQIRALRDFGDVKKGDLGGYIGSEENLSHEGDCWVYYNATVCNNAQVYDNAKIYGLATIYENAKIYGNAQILDAAVKGHAKLYGETAILGCMVIEGHADFNGGDVFGKIISTR